MELIEDLRNKKIRKLYQQGLSYGSIGKLFKLSRQRIYQIVGKSAYIYILKCKEYYKIGQTTRPEQRIEALSNRVPFKIKLVAISRPAKDYKNIEAYLHRKFRKKKYKGEWYILNKKEFKRLKQIMAKIDYRWKAPKTYYGF